MTASSRYRGSGAFAAPGASLSGFGGTVRRVAARAAGMLLDWADRLRQRQALTSLGDHLLNDIGLTRADVSRESNKPFWRE